MKHSPLFYSIEGVVIQKLLNTVGRKGSVLYIMYREKGIL